MIYFPIILSHCQPTLINLLVNFFFITIHLSKIVFHLQLVFVNKANMPIMFVARVSVLHIHHSIIQSRAQFQCIIYYVDPRFIQVQERKVFISLRTLNITPWWRIPKQKQLVPCVAGLFYFCGSSHLLNSWILDARTRQTGNWSVNLWLGLTNESYDFTAAMNNRGVEN